MKHDVARIRDLLQELEETRAEIKRLRTVTVAALQRWWDKLDEEEREEVRKEWLVRFNEEEEFRKKALELIAEVERES